MTDHTPSPSPGTPPPWPPTPAAAPGYPTAPPVQPLPTGDAPAPPEPAPKRPKTGLLIASAAMVLAVAIAVVAMLLPDSTAPGVGLPDSADGGPTETPTTVTVNDTAALPIEVAGPSLFESGSPGGASLPTITGQSFDGSEVVIDGTEPTVIVVMAHWCPHCQAEIPRIVAAYQANQLPAGVRVVGLATANDERRGNFPPAEWLDREEWPFAVMVDDEEGSALHALGVEGFPTMIAVTSNGVVADHLSGQQDLVALQRLWNAALESSSN